MTSMLPFVEESAQLVGVDPDDTDIVEHNGARFTLGVIPAHEWEYIDAQKQEAYKNAARRSIAVIAAAGNSPDEVVGTTANGVQITVADLATHADREFREASGRLYLQALKLGLRGHENFVNRKGKPFPFERNADGTVADSTLRVYAANRDLVDMLYYRLRTINDFGTVGKKA